MDIANDHAAVKDLILSRLTSANIAARKALLENLQITDKAIKTFIEGEMLNVNTTKYARDRLIAKARQADVLYWDLMNELVEARDRDF